MKSPRALLAFVRALLGLVVVALVAGCFGGGEAPPVTTTPPTATPTPSTTPTPASPTPTPTASPTSPTAPTPPEPLPPRVLMNVTFDFNREGDPTGQSPRTRASQALTAGYATVVVNASLERASPAPATLPVSGSLNQPTIRIVAPDGSEVARVDAEGETASVTVAAQVGTWNAIFEGSGTMRGVVVITAFA